MIFSDHVMKQKKIVAVINPCKNVNTEYQQSFWVGNKIIEMTVEGQ
jgi:hypothetical protein